MSSSRTLFSCLAGLACGLAAGVWQRPAAVAPALGTAVVVATTPGPASRDPLPVAPPGKENAETWQVQVETELAGGAASERRLQALFMQWFQEEPDLWPVFQELERQFPDQAGVLTGAFFGAWAWRDCQAACGKITGSALKARGEAATAAWKVACVLENEAAFQLEAGLYVKDWSPLERAARRNPAFAVRMLGSLRDNSGSQMETAGSVLAVARGWARRDPRAALEWAAAQTEGGAGAFQTVCAAWHRQDPKALGRLSGPLRERLDKDALGALLAGSAAGPPGSPPVPGSEGTAAVLLDPFATLDEVKRLMQSGEAAGRIPGGLSPYVQRGAGGFFPADPQAALEDVFAQPPGPQRDKLAGPLLSVWNLADPEAAEAFAAQQGLTIWNPEEPWKAHTRKIEGLTLADALRVCVPPDGSKPDFNALSTAVSQEVKQNPAAVTAFLEEHMDQVAAGEGSWRMVLSGTAWTWAQRDLAAATEWAATLPAGSVRDAAIGGMIEEMSDYDAETALTWMATMAHPGTGSHDLASAARNLEEQLGKTGARLAIGRSAFSEAQKQKMLETLK